jgi:hypothetical protein
MNESIKEKRKILTELSKDLKPLVQQGLYESLNSAIINHYAVVTNSPKEEFKTFKQWRKEGFFVRKGEKSFPIWGSPMSNTANEYQKEGSVFYPLCFLFGKHQVEPLKNYSNDKVLHHASSEA